MIQENFRKKSICNGRISHVPSQPAGVPSSQSMLSRDRSMPFDTWNLSGTQGNVFGNPRLMFDSTQTPYQGNLHSTNPSATGSIPVQVSTGRLVARDEEQIGSTTPMLMSARRLSTMNSFLPAEIPQNSLAVQQRLQISELQFDKFSTPSSFALEDKIQHQGEFLFRFSFGSFTNQVTTCSDFPSETMLWIKEVEMVDSVDQLKSSRLIEGKDFPNFEMLDARIASALNKNIQHSHSKKEVSLEAQKAQKEDQFLRAKQIAYMIYDYFRVTGAHDTVLESADLFSITLRNYEVQDFDTRRDEILLPVTKIPPDGVLESLYKLRRRESDQPKTVLELYDMEIHQKIAMHNYQKLKTMVKRSTDHEIFDARDERNETGAVVTSRRGLSGIARGKGVCNQWKAEWPCSRGDQCSFGHDGESVQNRHRKPLHPPTPRGRSASRKRSLKGRSQSGKSNRPPCKNLLKGTCWHPPECQFYKSESGCKFGAECSFPHWKVEGSTQQKAEEGW